MDLTRGNLTSLYLALFRIGGLMEGLLEKPANVDGPHERQEGKTS